MVNLFLKHLKFFSPIFYGLYDFSRIYAGSTLKAASLLLDGVIFISIFPPNEIKNIFRILTLLLIGMEDFIMARNRM